MAVQTQPVMPLKDPTSDMAVIARNGSGLVKEVRIAKEKNKHRARFWEMAGSKMAKITGESLVQPANFSSQNEAFKKRKASNLAVNPLPAASCRACQSPEHHLKVCGCRALLPSTYIQLLSGCIPCCVMKVEIRLAQEEAHRSWVIQSASGQPSPEHEWKMKTSWSLLEIVCLHCD